MKYYFLLFCLLFKWGIGQSTKSVSLEFPRISSTIAVPIAVPLDEVSKMVNSSIKELIYEDISRTDNNNDQFRVKVWKTSPIKLYGGKNSNVIIEVPLKIWAEKGIGTLGYYSYQETTFETVMSFSAKINFNKNWTITSHTKSNGYKWVSKPVLDFGTIKIPITSIVEKNLIEQQKKFCTVIDEQIATYLNLQPYIITTWNAFSEPLLVSEEYQTWLKISPQHVYTTPLEFYANQINLNVGIETYSETFTGSKPTSNAKISQAPFWKQAATLPKEFLLQNTSNIPYSEATRLARELFLDKEFDFDYGKEKVKITNISVYEDQQKVMIEATTSGGINGNIYIAGTPYYDAQKHRIALKDTTFKLKTKNILQKIGSSLFKGKIISMIEDEYGIPTQELQHNARISTEQAFNKEYHTAIQLTGKVLQLQPSQVIVTSTGLTAVIDIRAQLQLKVKNF